MGRKKTFCTIYYIALKIELFVAANYSFALLLPTITWQNFDGLVVALFILYENNEHLLLKLRTSHDGKLIIVAATWRPMN